MNFVDMDTAHNRRHLAKVKKDILWFTCVLTIPVALCLGITTYGFVVLLPTISHGQCGLGYFQCGNSSTCVAQEHQCDGIPDCEGGEDEDALVCEDNEGYVQVFLGLIDGIYDLPPIDQCDLEHFPTSCRCSFSTSVNCVSEELQHPPQPISANATKLILSNNIITTIGPDDFRDLPSLEILHLSENLLTELQPRVFCTLVELKKLYLSYNDLHTISPGAFTGLVNLEWLILSGNQLTYIPEGVLDNLVNLKHLDLSDNKLYYTRKDVFYLPPFVRTLILDRNNIQEIGHQSLRIANATKILFLAYNNISWIHPAAFIHSPELVELDLSSNALLGLPSRVLRNNTQLSKLSVDMNAITMDNLTAVLQHTTSLKSLSLKKISMSEPHYNSFMKMKNLTYVKFDSHRYCRYAPQAQVCEPKEDGISSLRNMLHHTVHRISIWVIALLTICGNLLVIVCRIFWKEESDIHAFFIKSLCAADMMTGLFLLIVATYDIILRDEYNRYALWWVNSWACTAAGVLGVMAAEVSILILTFMSFERYYTISFPFRERLINLRRAKIVLLAIWIAGLTLAVVPLTSEWVFGKFYTTNGVCFPLFLDAPFSSGWQYSTFILLGINFAAFLMVCYFYGALFWNIRQIQNKGSSLDRTRLTKRLLLIVLTDFMCVVPIIVLKILVLLDVQISANLCAWITVFVLPVNSASNPLVYTMTTPPFCRKVKQIAHPEEPLSTKIYRRFRGTEFSLTSVRHIELYRTRHLVRLYGHQPVPTANK